MDGVPKPWRSAEVDAESIMPPPTAEPGFELGTSKSASDMDAGNDILVDAADILYSAADVETVEVAEIECMRIRIFGNRTCLVGTWVWGVAT